MAMREMERARRRIDVASLQRDADAYLSMIGCYSEDAEKNAAIDRILSSAADDPGQFLAYFALISDATQDPDCLAAFAIGPVDSFLRSMSVAGPAAAQFDEFFDRIVAESLVNPVWKDIFQTSCWWALPRRFVMRCEKELGFLPEL